MPPIQTLRPQGRLDANAARQLEARLRELLESPPARILIDLTDTRYVSSYGLGVFVRAYKIARRGGGMLKLCCAQPRVAEIIAMAGLDQVFEMYETRAAAERAFE